MSGGKTPVHNGSCHCGRVRFRLSAAIDHKRICNCSICHKRGALIFRVEQDQIELLTPFEDLHVYSWGTGTAQDYFCKTCGILPFRRPRQNTVDETAAGVPEFTGWAVNLRCLDGFDPSDLPIRHIDGLALPLP
ncbi:GFA family protein [Aliisedimentitalea scapharcae]|uniref:GFA family protein n=1 Tax=Aliisedimentitalea scapharcae TaxID=1524259 RepID=A0ABZ2XQP3_9RHOB